LKDAGILRGYRAIGRHSLLAGKNLTDPDWGQRYADNVSRDAKEWVVTPQPSFNCPIGCAYDARITTGPFSGYTVSLCGGGENTEGAAAMIGVEDAGTALVLTDYYDAIGMDSSVAGCVISMAFELYNRGLLTQEQTDGLELTWGNHEAAMELLDRMIRREGFGAVLAQGMKAAAASLGPEAERALVHVKGSGMNLHDWRAAWSVLLGQVVAAASACWQGTGADALGLEPDLGYRTFTRNDDLAGKPESVRRTQIKKLFDDCLGICWFATWGVENVTKLAPAALAAATGWDDFDTAEAFAVGERVINLERLIACRRGFTKSDEWDVSPRLLEAPPTGRAAGTAFGPHLKALVHEYYDLMGWDKATGRPLSATLERLGLADAIVT
ncbi:MAG: aldehyde ferredoxin oxidoreductase C-terminal domain-containing protein, partial [Chloroflexi bacterium]|nr:aldehyde ferredoxin oxidoreductase C-terminal domain-containing protein [Chloroflexota bacterium]